MCVGYVCGLDAAYCADAELPAKRKMSLLQGVPLLAVLLLTTRVQLASARESSRDTTLATFNVGLVEGLVQSIDAKVAVLIDQVREADILQAMTGCYISIQ